MSSEHRIASEALSLSASLTVASLTLTSRRWPAGEAVFTFPILHNTVWRLVLVALVACGLGRIHVIIGARLTHLARLDRSPEGGASTKRRRALAALSPAAASAAAPTIHGLSLVLWWSGLRGGVAFALAASSFAYGDFEVHCGGADVHRVGAHHHAVASASAIECRREEGKTMTDGLAILQTTLLVATFSIFVLGGSVKSIAECAGVLKHQAAAAEYAAVRPAARLAHYAGIDDRA